MTSRVLPQVPDAGAVAAMIGRPPRSEVDVVTRCHFGLPTVVRMPPRLPDGEPFPTRYWLVCPLLVRRIARIEADGGVAELDARVESEEAFAAALGAAHARAAAEREELLGDAGGPRPSGGVAGSRGGVKCLHAHYADLLGAGDNPVGREIATRVGTTDCATPCVAVIGDAILRAPDWHEPASRMR